MVQVKKSRSLNVHIDNVYSEYQFTEHFGFMTDSGDIETFQKDIFAWRNTTNNILIGRREIIRFGNNYVNLSLN